MGLPKILLSRVRRTKGTKVFYTRRYYAFGGVCVAAGVGLLLWNISPFYEQMRKDFEDGLYVNSPEYEWRKFLLTTGVALPQTSKQLAEEKERLNNLPDRVVPAS